MEKNELIYWARIVCLFLYGLLTIITCAGVWNYNPEGFVKVCAGLLFLANAASIYCLAKRLKAPEKEKEVKTESTVPGVKGVEKKKPAPKKQQK